VTTQDERDEDDRLRSVALQTAASIDLARLRAERDLVIAKEALERKTEELARSVAMMRATLESTADGLVVTSADRSVTGFNQKYVQMWQLPADIMESLDHDRALRAIGAKFADPDQFLAGANRIYETSPAESFDVLELADGRVIERYSRVQTVDGTNVGRVWSFRDITERMRVERALREETRVLELLNNSGAALASKLDVRTIVQGVTDAATELSGAKFGAFFYNTWEDGEQLVLYALSGAPREAFERFGHPRATAIFGPTFRGEPPIRCDDVLLDSRYGGMAPHHGMPAGHLAVRSYLAVPVISRSGETIGALLFGHPEPGVFTERTERIVVGISAQAAVAIDNARLYEAAQREIHDRKLADEALRFADERFRFMAESMPQKIFTASAEGRFEYLNQQWAEYTGLSLEAIVGSGWACMVHPDDIAETMRAWQQSMSNGKPFQIEHRLRSRDDASRWHLGRAEAMRDAAGSVMFWSGSNTDIHDLKLALEERAQLLESERSARSVAEHASAMKDDFLATLSHELRTPLGAILGWSQVLRLRTTNREQLESGLQTIERNARMQAQLIEDLLDMSRITSGKVRLDIQPVAPVSFIEAAVETVRPAAQAKNVRLETLLDPNAGPVSGDPNRLQQVVWNLLSNAIKFTPKDGKVKVGLQSVNSQVEITVTDSGIGIPPEFLPHVFERFRQADSSTTRKFGGLGLGLSIVRSLVELHGGTVGVRSGGEGQGSTFVVHLPLTAIHTPTYDAARQHPRVPRATTEFARTDLSGVKVLIVDDEADARGLIQRLLLECDAEVTTAASASEALALMEREQPDVLVSDIGMPEVDGYELLRRVRALAHDRGRKIPAIALTAFARSEDRTKALRAGFQVHVSKPVEPSELVATVASVAGRTQTI
jgi:PAS domain S-box-containing protein